MRWWRLLLLAAAAAADGQYACGRPARPFPPSGFAERQLSGQRCYGSSGKWCNTAPEGCCLTQTGEVGYCCYPAHGRDQKCCFIDAADISNSTCCDIQMVCGAVCSQRKPMCVAPGSEAAEPAPDRGTAAPTAAPEEFCNFDEGKHCCGSQCCDYCCYGANGAVGCLKNSTEEVCCSDSSSDPILGTATCPVSRPQCCAPPNSNRHDKPSCCAEGAQCCATSGCPSGLTCCPAGCGCCHANTQRCRDDGTCEEMLTHSFVTPLLLAAWGGSVIFSLSLFAGSLWGRFSCPGAWDTGPDRLLDVCDSDFGGCGHDAHCLRACEVKSINNSLACATCASYCRRGDCHYNAKCLRPYAFEERTVRRHHGGERQTVQCVVTNATCPCTHCACMTCVPFFPCPAGCGRCRCADCRDAEVHVPWGAVLPCVNGVLLYGLTLVLRLTSSDSSVPPVLIVIAAAWALLWGGAALWAVRRSVLQPVWSRLLRALGVRLPTARGSVMRPPSPSHRDPFRRSGIIARSNVSSDDDDDGRS